MKQNPSREADSRSANLDISRLFLNPRFITV